MGAADGEQRRPSGLGRRSNPALQSSHAPCRFRVSILVAALPSSRAGKAQVYILVG
jgi:hypothetical protein